MNLKFCVDLTSLFRFAQCKQISCVYSKWLFSWLPYFFSVQSSFRFFTVIVFCFWKMYLCWTNFFKYWRLWKLNPRMRMCVMLPWKFISHHWEVRGRERSTVQISVHTLLSRHSMWRRFKFNLDVKTKMDYPNYIVLFHVIRLKLKTNKNRKRLQIVFRQLLIW